MDQLPEELSPLLAEQLREQLNNLTASVQLLTPVIREQCGSSYDNYLAIMNQSIYRIMRMANHLEYAHLPEGETVLNRASFDLAGLCRDLGGQVAYLAEQMEVTFTLKAECDTLITTGDATLLQRMLLNLIGNALRSAGEGGQAGLRLQESRGRATLTVWDSGPGLLQDSGDETSLILRPHGLGLGLPVAMRIARLHGGTLVLEHGEDRGLRAVVSLPVLPPEGGQVLRTPRPAVDLTGGFSPTLLELSDVLPYRVFLPEDVE